MAVRLRHIHIPGRPTYALASALQELLRRRLLDAKDSSSRGRPAPPPTLLSFTPTPTYTLGRRQALTDLSPSDRVRLTQPLRAIGADGSLSESSEDLIPEIVEAPRGGLTTYHGPGQLVLWPILDLKASAYRQFSVRCYSRLLEDVTSATLQRRWGLEGVTTDDPGVWVASSAGSGELAKIAALGVHLRRHVSALGVALNLDMPPWRVGDAPTEQDLQENPWARIVACGLEGKPVTSVAVELGAASAAARALLDGGEGLPGSSAGVRDVAGVWAAELAARLQPATSSTGDGTATEGEADVRDGLVEALAEPVVSELVRTVTMLGNRQV